MNEFKTLAQRLKYAMDILPSKKIKGVELARAVGVKPPSVSDWISGKSKTMEGENLLKAANFLGVNPIWLASGIGQPQKKSSTDNEISNIELLTTSTRSKKLDSLVKKLEEMEQDETLTEREIALLEHTIEIISHNKQKSTSQHLDKNSFFKE